MSCVGFWFALEDATRENGGMCAMPGAHRGPLRQRFRRKDGALVTETLDTGAWPEGPRVALEAKRGTMIALHGSLPHHSGPNRSDRSRHAYTLHVIDGACRYPADNWLRRGPELPLRGFQIGPTEAAVRSSEQGSWPGYPAGERFLRSSP